MSMIGNLARVTNETRLQLQESPELVMDFLYPDSALETHSTLTPIQSDDSMDIGKAWHALHFLFTGSDREGDFPEGFLVNCGEPVGDVDVGYGPARTFEPDEVAAISNFLESQNESELKGRLDPEKMDELEIYPSGWLENSNSNELREYLMENFRTLKLFIRQTADRRMALLVYLN